MSGLDWLPTFPPPVHETQPGEDDAEDGAGGGFGYGYDIAFNNEPRSNKR